MFLVLIISVPIALFLIWGVAYDLKQRRRTEPMTSHNARKVARDTRTEAEGKGPEWGL